MRKNGFTLIELIAVIAILGILSVMVSPALMGIRTMVMENSLESKISMVESAAIEYASEHIMEIPSPVSVDNCICDCTGTISSSCTSVCKKSSKSYALTNDSSLDSCKVNCLTVSVKTLINRGYLVGDEHNKEILSNPFSNVPFNNYDVCIRFNNNDAYKRQIIAYIIGEGSLRE